jgi:hypothetical protein
LSTLVGLAFCMLSVSLGASGLLSAGHIVGCDLVGVNVCVWGAAAVIFGVSSCEAWRLSDMPVGSVRATAAPAQA